MVKKFNILSENLNQRNSLDSLWIHGAPLTETEYKSLRDYPGFKLRVHCISLLYFNFLMTNRLSLCQLILMKKIIIYFQNWSK